MASADTTIRAPLVDRLVHRYHAKTPEDAIQRFVENTLRETGQTKLPVQVDLVASYLGIKTRTGDYPFAGRIYSEPSGQLVMDLRAGDIESRKRFTCAHEIVHTAFPGFTRDARYRIDLAVGSHQAGREIEEYLCDFGAALFLMPAQLLVGRFDIRQGMDGVERLAEAAGASLEAAGNRLVSLSPTPAGFLVLEMGHKPADAPALRRGEPVEPKLRVRYATFQGLSSYVPRFKSVADDSLYSHALQSSHSIRGIDSLPGGSRPKYVVEAKYCPRVEGGLTVRRVLAIVMTVGAEGWTR